MNLRPSLQIQTALTAMRTVIVPAIDPVDKIAIEQAQLVIGMLVMMQTTLPLAYRYDLDELSRTLQLAETLQSDLAEAGADVTLLTGISAGADLARNVLNRAKADPAELEGAVGHLRRQIGTLVSTAYGDARLHGIIQRAVLSNAKEQLLRERAWVHCQGWESDPASLPAIETLM